MVVERHKDPWFSSDSNAWIVVCSPLLVPPILAFLNDRRSQYLRITGLTQPVTEDDMEIDGREAELTCPPTFNIQTELLHVEVRFLSSLSFLNLDQFSAVLSSC